MGMGNFFAIDVAADHVGSKSFLKCMCHLLDNSKIIANVWHVLPAGRQVPDPAIRFFWNDEGMSRSDWVNVEKDIKVVIFIEFVLWNLITNDF